MKKVLLVDDEIVIRENIRSCIDWEKEGFIYCGDAPDGEMALPMIDEWRPDILITDIKMPFMDGIELSTIVRQRLPETKIIILSGHDEFSYARTALRIGVEEYFLKPVSSADLVALLHTVGRKIDRERREKSKPAFTRDKLFGDLCGGLITEAEAREAAQALSLPLSASHYAAVVWDFRCPVSGSSLDEAALRLAQAALEARATGYGEPWRFARSRTETVWIVRGDSPAEVSAKMDLLQKQALPELDAALPCEVSIGAGSVQDRLPGIHASFLEAEDDLNHRRLARQNKSALWDTIGDEREISFLDRPGFLEFLKIGKPTGAELFIRDFAEPLRGIDWNSSLYGYYALNDLTLETLQEARRSLRLAEDPQRALEDLQRQIKEIHGWEQCLAYLRTLADAFWKCRSEASGKYGDLIAKVKDFIRERYGDGDLSLQDAAEHVSVSPSHLSKVFSQETGQTFIECLTQTRIRKAMELLQTTNDRTYEIAYQVGYGDAHYFSNLFKKTTGVSPREYRRQGRENDGPEGAPMDDDDRSA